MAKQPGVYHDDHPSLHTTISEFLRDDEEGYWLCLIETSSPLGCSTFSLLEDIVN